MQTTGAEKREEGPLSQEKRFQASHHNFYLIGFMGAGKTTVGRLLATRLGLSFFDLDEEIVVRQGCKISEIFDRDGEPFFRQLERETLGELAGPAVIALGGGAFMDPEIRQITQRWGCSVFLDWPFEILRQRVEGDRSRPLALDVKRMQQLFRERLPIYRRAHLVWSSKHPHREAPSQVVAQIVAKITKDRKVKDFTESFDT